jgi:hypothetical protein
MAASFAPRVEEAEGVEMVEVTRMEEEGMIMTVA